MGFLVLNSLEHEICCKDDEIHMKCETILVKLIFQVILRALRLAFIFSHFLTLGLFLVKCMLIPKKCFFIRLLHELAGFECNVLFMLTYIRKDKSDCVGVVKELTKGECKLSELNF